MYYKVIHNNVEYSKELKFTIKCGRASRGHLLTLYKPPFKLNVEKYAFNVRSVDIWNKLPQNIVNASNIKVFKQALNKLPASFYSKYVFIK